MADCSAHADAGVGVVQIFSGLEHNTTINICSLLKNTATKVTANVLSDEHNARLKVSTAANWGTSNSQHFMSACVHISHNNWLPVTLLAAKDELPMGMHSHKMSI